MQNVSNEKFTRTRKEVSINDLIPHPISKQVYQSSGIAALASSIKDFGGMVQHPQATLPNEDGKYHILNGNRRVLAATELGWKHLFIEVMVNLPPEDESLFIVESNNYRDKTPLEKYKEIQIYQVELPKRQGKRNDLANDEKVSQRKAIAEKMDIAESEVRDLILVGNAPNGEELLKSIDGKSVTLTAIARKVNQTATAPNYTGYVACEEVDLDLCACPVCNSYSTKRIEVIDHKLFYIN